ncbi:glycerate kinase isoform X2 [Aphidius gifuensis]|nr:glycerate kinase isoform X2 [Aphidius gifuensis]
MENFEIKKIRDDIKNVFLAGIEAVKPEVIIKNKIKINNEKLIIDNDNCIEINNNIYMIGFGKAVMGMSMMMEKILGQRLKNGIVSIPRGSINNHAKNINISGDKIKQEISNVINYRENGINNQPDEETLATTRDIINMSNNLSANDVIIILISGGGSALLTMPIINISLDVKLSICKKLHNAGANIKELNMIRQKLSIVKAGGLAKAAYPAKIIGLIMSDVIDDPVDLIASGPTVFSHKNSTVDVLKKYHIYDDLDENLKTIFNSVDDGDNDLSIMLDDKGKFKHVNNFIICNNKTAIQAIQDECFRKNLKSIILFDNLEGMVDDISKMYSILTKLICQTWSNDLSSNEFINIIKSDSRLSKINEDKINEILLLINSSDVREIILISGGEPSIVVKGSGKGGRNQHLALLFSRDYANQVKSQFESFDKFKVVFFSGGTDGQDGPTDAAGAFGYPELILNNDAENKLNAEFHLEHNDSYNFYKNINNSEDLLITGLTGTNVMDIHLIYIFKKI